jgi:RNA polymerase sigma-70 factor (ECF subfamily)
VNDVELVERARGGDGAAFGELVDRHRTSVYRAAVAVLGVASEAEDAAQDAFVTAYQKLGDFRGDSSFKTWLLTIAWRKALDRRRSIGHWIRVVTSATSLEPAGAESPLVERLADGRASQEEALLESELEAQIRQLVRRLPAKLRDVLLLAGTGEHSYDEIARMLAIPVGTVKWRASEARRLLRVKLQRMGYGNG